MKRVLITGAAGFIGSNAWEHFIFDPEYKAVAAIDSLTYASDSQRVYKYSDQAIKNSGDNIVLYAFDICDSKMEYILKCVRPDVIINYAASSHVDRSIETAASKEFVMSNCYGVVNLVNAVRGYQKKSGNPLFLIHISTDETLGDLPIDSKEEFPEYEIINPGNLYSATKAAAEHVIAAMHHTYNDFEYAIVRATNNYGPNQHLEKFIPKVISSILKNEKIPIYGNGGNIREWLWVGDFVEGTRKVLEAYFLNRLHHRVYHFGSGVRLTNLEVVKTILKIMNKDESLISFVEDRLGHDRRYALDSSLARQELSWKPEQKFEEGLKIVIDDITKRMNIQ